MEVNIYYCDICTKEMGQDSNKARIPVVFTTEQNEGRPVAHYLTNETIEICEGCHKKILSGKIPFGQGTQGHNNYWFK